MVSGFLAPQRRFVSHKIAATISPALDHRRIGWIIIVGFSLSLIISTQAIADPIVEFNFDNGAVTDIRGGVTVISTDVEGFAPGTAGTDGALFGEFSQVEATPAINRNTSFSVSAWFRPDTVRSPGQSPHALVIERNANFLDSCSGAISCANFGIEIYEGEFAFEVSTSDQPSGQFFQTRLLSGVAPVPGQLYHVVAIYDQDIAEGAIYIDGQLASRLAVRPNLKTDGNARLRLARNGGLPTENVQFYDGLMDEILIFDRALSPAEIVSIFEAGTDADDDNDGVLDADDQCAGTPDGEATDTDGCAISQLCPCEGEWKNHGAYVRCVAQTAEVFVSQGLITEPEKGAIVSAAGQSSCGKKK